ncbi:MAG TPA: class I SAM-dependent methyltransferase [Pyrinomonadaceae bacterium]|nr:class I SAM-dependent methyltransferase [Pyrinomonadaceae bacterium]
MVELPDNSTETLFSNSLPLTGEGVVIDIGAGDGLFVYQSARRNPRKFYIGIDANPRPLAKISEKIHRKPAKGGLANVLFLQAAVEDLPEELNETADEAHVHFPWGSLLRAVAIGDPSVLNNLRRICSPEALLEVVIGVDPERDRTELERLGVPVISLEYIDSVLAGAYNKSGFEITERGIVLQSEWSCLETSWARRLEGNLNRTVTFFIARAI